MLLTHTYPTKCRAPETRKHTGRWMAEAPIDSVAHTLAEVRAETLGDTLVDVKAEALPYALADSVAEVKAETL